MCMYTIELTVGFETITKNCKRKAACYKIYVGPCIVNRVEGLEGRQTSKLCKLNNSRCWKGTSHDNTGA
jgi:hypothetical protein